MVTRRVVDLRRLEILVDLLGWLLPLLLGLRRHQIVLFLRLVLGLVLAAW